MGGGGKGGGADLRLGGGQKDRIALIFPPSHLLCTIKSQLGAKGAHGVNGEGAMAPNAPKTPPIVTPLGGWNKKFLEMHVYIVIMYFLKQIDMVGGGGGRGFRRYDIGQILYLIYEHIF